MWIVLLIIFLIILFFALIAYEFYPYPPLTFIHIPKTGGTEIRYAGSQHGYIWVYWSISSLFDQNCNLIHVPPTSFVKNSFAVVRNPYDRAISEYKYMNPNNQSIEGLNTYIQSALREKNTYGDCHWLPQYDYAKYSEHVLRYENLSEDFAALMTKYNLPVVLDGHENKSNNPLRLSVSNLTPETITMINKRFLHDFTEYGYSMI